MLEEKESGQEKHIEQKDKQQDLHEDRAAESAVANSGQPASKHIYKISGGFTNDEQSGREPSAIVGIGASGGGLEAFMRLLEKLPNDTGMAFVYIQRMEQQNRGVLADILSKTTSMTVNEVENNMVLQPNHVYIFPPTKAMSVSQGVLNLVAIEDTVRQCKPIDYFLESLAMDQGSKAIGVILSGTSTDGSRGLKEIKTVGGITFAQKPQTAKFDIMPLNVIANGVVDFVLSSEEIANELVQISRSSIYDAKAIESVKLFSAGADELKQVFTILHKATGTNISEYRELTIKRRILRRMILHKIEKLGDYINYLQQNPVEVEGLYQDILINVTSFFRDPEAFETLKSLVLSAIMNNKASGKPIRVWVPGCSTGEEAYSIAILLIEFLGDDFINTPIQIFATDINDLLIVKARLAIYSKSIEANVSPERLRRFFVKLDKGYQIVKTVRDLCVFARQDILKDPPFCGLDLISCRNAIIYFGRELQKKLFPVLHYALNQKGFLFLGSSESVGVYANLFNLVDKKHKIYSKIAVSTPFIHEFIPSDYMAITRESREGISRSDPKAGLKFNVLEEANRIVLSRYAPVGVVINSDLEIIQFRGRTGAYLESAPGTPSLKFFKMIREGLSLGLHSAINQANKDNISVRMENLQVINNGRANRISVDVIPIGDIYNRGKYYLILFREMALPALPEENSDDSLVVGLKKLDDNIQLINLEHELIAMRECLQTVIENHELTNDQLRAANEEIQSSNEELQSMNEELETTKEELQSSNEELRTLYYEAQNRNLELSEISGDLFNLFRSINIPVVILSDNLFIRRFNPAAEKVFNLIATDVGRPITDINTKFNNYDLEEAILKVIDTLISMEQEVQDRDGYWYSVQIRPYRTVENKIDGVVITFVEIDTVKKSLILSQEAREYAEAIVETVREPLLILDVYLQVKSANKAFYQTFMVTQSEAVNQSIFALGNGQWNIPELRVLLEDTLSKNAIFEGFEVSHDFPHIGYKKMLINCRMIVGSNSQTKLILMAIEDVTEHVCAEKFRKTSGE